MYRYRKQMELLHFLLKHKKGAYTVRNFYRNFSKLVAKVLCKFSIKDI